MNNSERLSFINKKTTDELYELWMNCFDGQENNEHMHSHIPNQFRIPSKEALFHFLTYNSGTWLVKRIADQDIIGFAVHGDFMPGMENNIGFNIGLNYTRHGYASETLQELIEVPRRKGLSQTFGHCLESNIGSIKTMEKCGFQNLGRTGRQFNGVHELKFRIQL